MVSVTSVTDKYILQPSLLTKHRRTLDAISAAVLWKLELTFFQRLLDRYAPKFSAEEDKKLIDHFQSIFLYYRSELIDFFITKLRLLEASLAVALETHNETKLEYFRAHDSLLQEIDALRDQYAVYKEEFFKFIQRGMSSDVTTLAAGEELK